MKIRTTVLLAAAFAAAAACDQTPTELRSADVHRHEDGMGAARPAATTAAGLAAQVKSTTARFHSTVQAEKHGYAADPFCVAAPGLGGMGHHWVNQSLVDPVFDPFQPEVMLYAPDRNGKLKLVAVEYIVIDVGQPAPTFAGQPFDIGGTPVPVPHWSLHVWVHEDNPNGLFTPFNPQVSCPAS
jgi:hypothetical protein